MRKDTSCIKKTAINCGTPDAEEWHNKKTIFEHGHHWRRHNREHRPPTCRPHVPSHEQGTSADGTKEQPAWMKLAQPDWMNLTQMDYGLRARRRGPWTTRLSKVSAINMHVYIHVTAAQAAINCAPLQPPSLKPVPVALAPLGGK